ncbi:MAG: glycosyltransferase, partial [Bacteroidota bacterium]|nr:glycosyltransferase [Bacteroidota bacterium]
DVPLIASETISLTNTGVRHRFAIWIRMNLFVPDARVGWYFSAVSDATKMLSQTKFDVIVSIGPPHSSHLIGKKLSKQFNIPHVPVLIDPWVDIIYYKGFKRSSLTLSLDNYLERTTLDHAGKVIFVTQSMREDYIKKYPWIEKKSSVLYWGYNEESFEGLKRQPSQDQTEVILHAGNIFDYQNPTGFWKNIKQEIDKGRKLKLRFIGTVSPEIKKAIESAGLNDNTQYKGFLPYNEVIQEMMNASYLLVCTTEKRHVPGKLFEYLRTGNKIIAFGDNNKEVEEFLEEMNAGKIFPYNYNGSDIFQQADKVISNGPSGRNYSREIIAGELAELLEEVV